VKKQRNLWILALTLSSALASTVSNADDAKVYGTVTDASGNGVPNVKVILEPIGQGVRAEVASKGKKGTYLIGIVRPGRYALKVNGEGLGLVSIKADAIGQTDHLSKWKLEGRVKPDKAPELGIEDGIDVTCDLVVGQQVEAKPAAAAAAAPAAAAPSAEQTFAGLTQQVQKGDCAGALPQLEKFNTDNPNHAKAFYLRGYCDAVLSKDDDAIDALNKSIELDPKFAGISTLVGKVHARNKRLPDAEAAFKQELANDALAPELKMDALLSLGAVQRDQAKDTDAIATFERAAETAPSRPEPYVELSTLYTKTGQTDKAAAILNKAKEVGADDPVAMLNVGISYFNKKDFEHAETMFRRVTESKAGNSDMAMAYGLLGKLQMRAGKNADATASFKKSLELDPEGRLAAETQAALKAIEPKKK
jgi:Flp pilus assembly protein TadD